MDSESVWAALLALGADELDDDPAADLVHVLHQRAEPEVLGWALAALADLDPWHRQAAAWVLGELGYEEGRPFGDRVAPALVEAARAEQDDETRGFVVRALGRADDPAWAPDLLRYADDPYPPVREAVAGALPIMFCGEGMSTEAVAALVRLTRDVDPDVRDWATFALGTQSLLDTPEIRDALAARLDDEGADTRFEAAMGLARRGDGRVLTSLLERFDDEAAPVYLPELDAAGELADPALLPALSRLRAAWGEDKDEYVRALLHAIDRCTPAHHVLAATRQAELADAVNGALEDTGWVLALDGDYPGTIVSVRRPDGTLDPRHPGDRLWEGTSPTELDVGREAARWVAAMRTAAAAGDA